MILVDANVAVKWFLPEPLSEAAGEILHIKDILVAPDLIRVEVAAAITKRFRRGELTAVEAKEIVALWADVLKKGAVQVYSGLDDLAEAGRLSVDLRHAIHDCLYLAMAVRLGARMITADRAFAEKAAAVYAGVELLGGKRSHKA